MIPFRLLLFFCSCCVTTPIFSEVIHRAQDYSRHSTLQWDWAMAAIDTLSFDGNERILDVGSGDGKITALLSQLSPEGMVVGLDASEEMVELASSTFDAHTYPNLLFLVGSADQLPFYQQFDLIFSNCCLHWVPNQLAALKGICNSLSSSGRALIVTVAPALSNVGSRCEELANTDKWTSYIGGYRSKKVYFSEEEYRTLIDKAGLEVDRFEVVADWFDFSSRSDFCEWLRPLVSLTRHLTLELQEEFLQDLVDYIINQADSTTDGSILIPFVKMEMLLCPISYNFLGSQLG